MNIRDVSKNMNKKYSGPSISTNHLLVREENIPWKAVGKEIILLNLIDGEYYIINNFGLKIWEMSSGTNDIESISKEISKRYKVEITTVIKDIITFAKKLLRLRLIKINLFPTREPINQVRPNLRVENWQTPERLYLKPKLTRIGTLKSDIVEAKYRHRLIESNE